VAIPAVAQSRSLVFSLDLVRFCSLRWLVDLFVLAQANWVRTDRPSVDRVSRTEGARRSHSDRTRVMNPLHKRGSSIAYLWSESDYLFSSLVTLYQTTRLTFHLGTRLENIFKAQDSRLITTVAFDYLVSIDFLFSQTLFVFIYLLWQILFWQAWI
jgi:hypothetical protein